MSNANHIVAVFGGAVSGAEAAFQLAERGIKTIVFDQNILPYGKIEDGLPKWHAKLRDKEEGKINDKLSHPNIHFVPGVKLGKDIDFEEVAREWGFSAVLLAIGAWRDRPLSIPDINDYVGKGLTYQNPLIYWYNHKHEPNYNGPTYDIHDESIIIGGGLASLDVAKVIMFELVEKALAEKGHEVNLFTLDRSIAKVLDALGFTLEDLGIKGCTLYYRRRIKDMPLSPLPSDTPEQLEKAERVRAKIFNNYQSKYLFNMKPCHVPVDKIVEQDQLVGLVMQETRIENGKVVPIPGSEHEVRGPEVIASIGSIPEVINGIPMQWQVYKVIPEECCRIDGFSNVFALGNAVTGRGNIKESLQHGRETSLATAERYLSESSTYESGYRMAEANVDHQLGNVSSKIQGLTSPTTDQTEYIMQKVKTLQQKIGYKGDFKAWVAEHLPPRLEDMIIGGH